MNFASCVLFWLGILGLFGSSIASTSDCLFQPAPDLYASIAGDFKTAVWNIESYNSTTFLSLCRPLNFSQDSLRLCNSGYLCSISRHVVGPPQVLLSDGLQPSIIRGSDKTSLHFVTKANCLPNKRKQVIIQLICSLFEYERPSVEEQFCTTIYTIPTKYACQSTLVEKAHGIALGPCAVEDPETGYRYNLTAMANPGGYSVYVADGHSYVVGICGAIKMDFPNQKILQQCNGMGACQVIGNQVSNAGEANSKLQLRFNVEEPIKKDVVLMYTAKSAKCPSGTVKTTLHLQCVYSETQVLGPYIQEKNCDVHIFFLTPHACPIVQTTTCSVKQDPGQVLDLSSLTMDSDNYHVHLNPGKNYPVVDLNVCRSLVPSHSRNGCKKDSGACLRRSNEEWVSLGQPLAPSLVNDVLTLDFMGGDPCSYVPGYNYSLSIQLHCSDQDHMPQFISYDDTCKLMFSWYTKKACANYNDIKEIESNPVLKRTLNFTTSGGKEIVYNPLGAKTTPCGPNTAVCLLDPKVGVYKSVGQAPPTISRPHHGEGLISLTYSNGGPCSQGNMSSIVHLLCGSSSHILLGGVGLDGCTHTFLWYSPDFCHSKDLRCELIHGKNMFDLHPLAQQTHTIMGPNDTYHISLCWPLAGLTGLCPPNSAVCLQSVDGTVLDYGSVVSQKPLEDYETKAVMYKTSTPCNQQSNLGRGAHIEFLCNPHAGIGEPILLAADQCRLEFQWHTALVCTQQELNDALTSTDSCQFEDTVNKVLFNLELLQKSDKNPYVIPVEDEGQFHLSACSPISTSVHNPCFGAGACLVTADGAKVNFGLASPLFSYENATLVAIYRSQVPCASDVSQYRSTRIQFVCNQNGTGAPKIIGLSMCQAMVEWPTSQVCPPSRKISTCVFPSVDREINMAPLVGKSHYWSTSDSMGNKYYTNLCGALPSSAHCPPGTAVCMLNTTAGSWHSLGNLNTQFFSALPAPHPQIPAMVALVAYTGEDPCPGSMDKLSSATIELLCSISELGRLEIDSTECPYIFRFYTSYACKTSSRLLKSVGWWIHDPRQQRAYNFTSVYQRNVALVDKGKNRILNIDLKGIRMCNQASVCIVTKRRRINIGGRPFFRFISESQDATKGMLVARLPGKWRNKCSNNSGRVVKSTIYFPCQNSSISSPEFLYEDAQCNYHFVWPSPSACQSFNMTDPGSTTVVKPTTWYTSPQPDHPTSTSIPEELQSSSIYLTLLYILLGLVGTAVVSGLCIWTILYFRDPISRTKFIERINPTEGESHLIFYKGIPQADDDEEISMDEI